MVPLLPPLGQEALHSPAKGRCVEPGKANEGRADPFEGSFDLGQADEAPLHPLPSISEIAVVTSGELGEHLAAQIVVKHVDLAPASEGWRVSLPIRKLGKKLVRACELDVDLELVLESSQNGKASGGLGVELEVDVHRRLAPSKPEGGSAPNEIERTGAVASVPELGEEALDPLAIDRVPHGSIVVWVEAVRSANLK